MLRSSLVHSRLGFCFLLSVVAMGLTACSSKESPKQMTRPPEDDSETSSVRIVTNWKEHSLGQAGCMQNAKAVLTQAKYFIDIGERSVYGLREGMTFSIRCDYEGVAFFAVAYRHRPSVETQNRIMGEVMTRF